MPINRVTIVGNLTRDPELRALPSGGNVCSLRVAVNERRKDGATGQWTDAPNFFNVTIFGNSADNAAKFLSKGRQVAVDGRLRWREWQDQQGNKRESIEIVAQDVQFIGGREGGGQQQGGGNWGQPPAQAAPPAQDDWGGGGGQQGGGFSGPGTTYPVEQGDFGGPAQGGGFQPQQPQQGGGYQQPPAQQPSSAPVADDDIPF